MKVTFILKDLTEAFYDGNGSSIVGLNALPDSEKFTYLMNKAQRRELPITMKIGDGSFRDQVDLNSLIRKPLRVTYKLESRKGYKLATFEVNPN